MDKTQNSLLILVNELPNPYSDDEYSGFCFSGVGASTWWVMQRSPFHREGLREGLILSLSEVGIFLNRNQPTLPCAPPYEGWGYHIARLRREEM